MFSPSGQRTCNRVPLTFISIVGEFYENFFYGCYFFVRFIWDEFVMKSTLSQFIILVFFLTSLNAHAISGDRDLGYAIHNIKSTQSKGGKIMEIGVLGMKGSFSIMLMSGLMGFLGTPKSSVITIIKYAGVTMAISAVGVAIGAVVYVLEPSPASAASVIDYYLTAEGFQEYLNLSAEEMEMYANWNPKLAELVLKISDGIEKASNEN